MLSSEKLNEFLCPALKTAKIELFEEISSTNAYLKGKGAECEEMSVAVASRQTAGKGRLGRSFYSPQGSGVYFSVLLKPSIAIEKAILITTAAAVAVTRTLELLGQENAQIKWVNDVFVNNKKVCGILTESVINLEAKALEFAVLGVGINLLEPENGFPEEISSIAGAAFTEQTPFLKERFVAGFLNEFHKIYVKLGEAEFMKEYKEKCFCLGREISVISGDTVRHGTAISIDENARLQVKFSEDCEEFISSGEISIKM